MATTKTEFLCASDSEFQNRLFQRMEELEEAGYHVWGGVKEKRPYGKNWQEHAVDWDYWQKSDVFSSLMLEHIGLVLPHCQKGGKSLKIGVVDCECKQTADKFYKLLQKMAPKLENKMHWRRNKCSGGEHAYILYPVQLEFASCQIVDPRVKMKKRKGEGDVVFEVLGRGKAKYCIVEAIGREHVGGPDLTQLEPLTKQEFQRLCKIFDEMKNLHATKDRPGRAKVNSNVYHVPRKAVDPNTEEETFIEKFNREFDVEKYLHSKGWEYESEDAERRNLTRPGKSEGVSASLRKDNHIFYCFSSSTEFNVDVGYSPFQVYALCECGVNKDGNYAAAVAKARKMAEEKKSKKKPPRHSKLFLPGYDTSVSECAENAFMEIAHHETMFLFGDKVREIRSFDGVPSLHEVTPEMFCSRLDEFFELCNGKPSEDGGTDEVPGTCTIAQARTILNAKAAYDQLPVIRGLSPIPVFTDTGRILTCGYDRETGWFITGKQEPYEMSCQTAVRYLKSLLRDFRFTSESDYSRALAALITPAYRFARFNKRVPLLWVEADDSQTGKGYFCECIATLYGHTLSFSAKRNGGVGSLDEDISAKLIAGANMIVVDNIRGKLDSMFLESLLTADGKVAMRGAYTKNIEIDPSAVLFMATSNGAMLTRDQANRVYTIRLRKQPEGYVFHRFGDSDLKEHIRANRMQYLGAVYAVLKEWIQKGKPLTTESRHPFREWTQCMDWIVQNLFEAVPMMDDYNEVKSRLSDPAMSFLRELALIVLRESELQGTLDDNSIHYTASELCELCARHCLEIPNLQSNDRTNGAKMIGGIFAKCFGEDSKLLVDDIKISRHETRVRRSDGNGNRPTKVYMFHKMMAKNRDDF